MGRKIFVSYKFADDDVENLSWDVDSTVREYVTEFEKLIDNTDHIYKGEHDDEDLSLLSEDTIWSKLRDKIYDSTLTVIFISPKMKENWKKDRDQWIPWEVSYSLKETSRKDSSGNSVTSRTNAMLAVVLPDSNGSYSYYLEGQTCCSSTCITHHIDRLFQIIRDNKFNKTNGITHNCDNNQAIWTGTCSYIEAVKWSEFKSNVNSYINKAYDRQDDIDNYRIIKTIL